MAPAAWPRQGVYKAGTGIWFVPSESAPGAYRRVEWHYHPSTGNVYTCTCPAGQRGQMAASTEKASAEAGTHKPCRHVRAVHAAEQADGYPPRPAAKPNISALVD